MRVVRTAVHALLVGLLLLPETCLVARAQKRPDRAFGFAMFPESSWVEYRIFWRAQSGREEAMAGGCFSDGSCLPELTSRSELRRDGQRYIAPYGARAVLSRLEQVLSAHVRAGHARGGSFVVYYKMSINLHDAQTGSFETAAR